MTSETDFGGLCIRYDARVLTPRAWTVLQARWAVEISDDLPAGPILELFAGAGQIGLLAALGSGRPLIAVDVDPVACDFARANAEAAGLAGLVEVREGDLGEALAPGELFGLIIADPPYLPTASVRSWPEDPPLAIDGGADGLGPARRCLKIAAGHLAPGGALLLQLANDAQADLVADIPPWRERHRRSTRHGVVSLLKGAEPPIGG